MVSTSKVHVSRGSTATPIRKPRPRADHHIVVGFEGFNLPLVENAGNEVPLDTKDNRVADIVNKATAGIPASTVSKAVYSTDITERARSKAETFIEDHLVIERGVQRGKVIIYGYSMGGDTAVELAESLKAKCIVDLLITVDAATPVNVGVERRIPSNVRLNINFWTNRRGWMHHGGGRNYAEDKGFTKVYNYAKHRETHASISKATKTASIKYIKAELHKKGYTQVHQPVELTFDGKEVIITDPSDRGEVARFAAISGLPAHAPRLKELIKSGRTDLDIATDYRGWQHQDVRDAGPIQETDFALKLVPGMPYKKTWRDHAGWGIGGWQLETSIWQDAGIWLGGRGGFYLHHDGGHPGTSGCIGISKADDMRTLRQLLINAQRGGQDRVKVHVIYDHDE